jgi:hypothetical protein
LLTFYVRSGREKLADRQESDDHPAIVEIEVDPLADRVEKICVRGGTRTLTTRFELDSDPVSRTP